MIDLFELQGIPDATYHSLCLPGYRALLQNRPPTLLVVGATRSGRPCGLLLANWQAHTQTAHLLSVVVAEEERRQGIGSALVQGAMLVLQRRGCLALSAEYVIERNEDEVVAGAGAELERDRSIESAFIQAQGFDTPQVGIHILSGSLQIAHDVLWLDTCKWTPEFSLDTWASLTPAERILVQQGAGVWYPPILSPFVDEAAIDQERSLLLRYRGEVIGWMIVEAFDAETILFKTMFVQQKHQRRGRGIGLFAEVGKRLLRDTQFHNGIFFVEAENTPMVRFLHARLVYPAIRKQVLMRTYRTL